MAEDREGERDFIRGRIKEFTISLGQACFETGIYCLFLQPLGWVSGIGQPLFFNLVLGALSSV